MSQSARLSVTLLDKAVHDRAAFHCGVDSLDQYLKRQAAQDQKRNIAQVYVLTQPGQTRMLGYYTLSSSGVDLSDLPEEQRRKLPGYPVIPVVLLGRLAVDESCKGQRLGEWLLMDCIQRVVNLSHDLGIYALMVDALDDGAARFYQRYGFMPLPDSALRLMLPMTTLRRLVEP